MKDKRKVLNVFKKVVDGDLKRVIINMPFLSGKTELCKELIRHGLEYEENCKFIYATYKNGDAVDFIRGVAASVDGGFNSKRMLNGFDDGCGGSVYAISTFGAITGYGAGSPDKERSFSGALILDDPNKFTSSKEDCKRVYDKFQESLRCRINSIDTPIIIIQTNTNRKNDLGNMLLKKDRDNWYHLNLE